ncbi:helix-turn-helix domain-containing protein [Adlercreutzia equolifaciens]|uniref:helix-turn-helix domain-containing protein n=2 Tax=Coriobacteriia TaxID=84998 RepID=UPI00189A94B6|nr:helix-turn-helix domain-containing protein [Adlercreutzia rubneri]MCB6761520.1 helix-turn-helix domain-containing protein [Adlercreutzia equolifaciens]MCB6977240.1 helix-turn-helix domain-containing protein [Adlercreutzia equolifaciens]MDE8685235.1 helix-turn-helix domain-containing protein [Adlercreutzia rubneri]
MQTIEQAETHRTSVDSISVEKAVPMPPLFTISELADYLQVSTATVYRLMRDGVLVGVRIGSSLRFTQKNIEDLLENCAIDADL